MLGRCPSKFPVFSILKGSADESASPFQVSPERGKTKVSEHREESPVVADHLEQRTQPFRWDIFLLCLTAGGVAIFIVGIVFDNLLHIFDVSISSWREALWSAVFGVLFSIPIAPMLWRLGLVTLPQYLLGAMAVFVPLTILSALLMSGFYDIKITVPDFDNDAAASQVWALTAYIRLARSAIFVPVFLITFWFTYHRVFKMEPRR